MGRPKGSKNKPKVVDIVPDVVAPLATAQVEVEVVTPETPKRRGRPAKTVEAAPAAPVVTQPKEDKPAPKAKVTEAPARPTKEHVVAACAKFIATNMNEVNRGYFQRYATRANISLPQMISKYLVTEFGLEMSFMDLWPENS